MEEQALQQLSKDVAEKYGIEPFITYLAGEESNGCEHCNGYNPITEDLWLHEDSARCFDLMVEHFLDVNIYDEMINASTYTEEGYGECNEYYTDHSNDKHLATRVAILKALLAKDKL